ncbi:uncharacterized protein BN584_01010 [Clostridium sp. CAG:277]|nr:uncharacterized protein BN584_01010 [Clostridium sp. CAG:277]
MKKGYKAIAVTLSMVLALTGVVGGAPMKGEAKAKIKLNKKKVTLTVGKSVKLKLKGTGKKARWSSSNESVAMVSSTGKVMAVSVGKAKIRAKIKKKKYSCSVTVKGKTTEPEEFWPVTQTKTPTATKAPAATAPVRKTNAPSNIKNPAGTGRPYGTNVPGKTDAPEVTKTPVKTEEPEETKAPAKTEEPEETKTPVKTEKPEETKTPVKTEKPEVTKGPVKTEKPNDTASPVKPRVVYQFVGSITGWGGPDTYPSSRDHEQGDGGSNSVNESLTNIKVRIGSYKCGLELMNKYSDNFIGASNELSQIIKGMTDPVIRVTLENGGAASAYNWYDELKCPSGEEVALTKEFLRNEYVGLFGNDDTITKVEIYDRAAAAVEPELPEDTKEPEQTAEPKDTKKPEQTAAPENPSRPEESYTPDIPVVTPGSADADNEALASNMKASLQKLSTGQILLKLVNNNDVTVNYFEVTVAWKDAQGNALTYESDGETVTDQSFKYGYFLEKNGLYYVNVNTYSENKDKIDLSKSEVSIKVDQTYTEEFCSPLTSKITVTSQKTVYEDGSSRIDYEIKNNDSKEAYIDLMFLCKDAQGNVIDAIWNIGTLDAGGTVSSYFYTRYDWEAGEYMNFASYEIYINGCLYDSES